MPGNLINTIRTKAHISYELYDDTVLSSNDFVRSLYHFRSKGSPIKGSSMRFIDDYAIEEAIVSADSFNDAIGWMERDHSMGDYDTLWTVEFIGHDNRGRDADRYLMTYTKNA